jgi:hypothetical protein
LLKLPDLLEAKMGARAYQRARDRKMYRLHQKGLSYSEIAKRFAMVGHVEAVKDMCESDKRHIEDALHGLSLQYSAMEHAHNLGVLGGLIARCAL